MTAARTRGPVPRVYAYASGEWHVSLENNHVRTTNVCSAFPMAAFFDVLTTDMRDEQCDEQMRRAPLCGRCFNPRHSGGLSPWHGPPVPVHGASVKLAEHCDIQPTEET